MALVLFYVPWCGHCKSFTPQFNEAASKLATDYPNISLLKVDCENDGRKACEENAITGYPTLKLFRNGKLLKEYDGGMRSDEIVDYMKAQVGPSSEQLEDHNDFNEFLSRDGEDVRLVGFFDTDDELKSAYFHIADEMRGKCRFGHTFDKDLMRTHGVQDGVVMFNAAFLGNNVIIGVGLLIFALNSLNGW